MPQRVAPRRPVKLYLAEWRDHKGLTQEQVGDELGVDKGVVSRWETGAREPTVSVIAAYAEVLKVPVPRLYRPPDEESLDDLVADSPRNVRRMATDVVKTIVRRGE